MIDAQNLIVVLGMFLAWDALRRFADRDEAVDPEEFQTLWDEVQSHGAHMKDNTTSSQDMEDLQAAAAKAATMLEDHKKVLASHASTLIAHQTELSKHGKSITDMGLARAGGKPRVA